MPLRLARAWVLIWGLLASPVGGQDLPALKLEPSSLPAAGRHQALLEVPALGRYSLRVESEEGVALRLVDRMAGPGALAGQPGEAAGRLDLFLGEGEYKLLTLGHERSHRQATLHADAFRERHPEVLPFLGDLEVTESELADLEQASYALRVERRQQVVLEAAGRHLADLRLWGPGHWLVDAAPRAQVIEPLSGKPLKLLQLTTDLEPGLYRLTAYGGPSQPWAIDDGSRPLYLRSGLPRAAEAQRRHHRMSPFGFDRFLVPGGASFFRLELPEARPAELGVNWHDDRQPFDGRGRELAKIDKDSRQPVAELRRSNDGKRWHRVTVRAEAGQSYLLQHFAEGQSFRLAGNGEYWVSTVHSGHPGDTVDATALVSMVRGRGRARRAEVVAAQTVELGRERGWARRFALRGKTTVLLRVSDLGSYEVLARGASARFRIEPFFALGPPKGYESPILQGSGSAWELEPGIWVLRIEPDRVGANDLLGILDLAVRPAGGRGAGLESLGAPGEVGPPGPAVVVFSRLSLGRSSYDLVPNVQPGVAVGVIQRSLPLDLSEPLPLVLVPGDQLEIPFRAASAGALEALLEDGSRFAVSIDGGEWASDAGAPEGDHLARLRLPAAARSAAALSLRWVPERVAGANEPAASFDRAPKLVTLKPGATRFFDLDRRQQTSFRLEAKEPALYRIESLGLLATEGRLRTRSLTALGSQAENGFGRNFLLQQYLRPGPYRLSVATRGETRGHLGVRLESTPVDDGGRLRPGLPARASLGAGEAVAYRFEVAEEGKIRLRSLGGGRTLTARLEDSEGWPVTRPGLPADLEVSLSPGDYRWIVLPHAVPGRVSTLLELLPEPPKLAGHGPFELPLATAREHLWLEPEMGEERTPDVWRFRLPAASEVEIDLDSEMQASLLWAPSGEPLREVAQVPPLRGWRGRLEAGEHELRVLCSRLNSRVAYRVKVEPRALLAGMTREVEAPTELELAVGEAMRVELSSFGATDVRAVLHDEGGRRLSAEDDRPEGWDFALTEWLEPGAYRLRVEPVGAESATTRITMRLPEEAREPAMELPGRRTLAGDGIARLFPLVVPESADYLVATAASNEILELSLETQPGAGSAWHTVARRRGTEPSLALPLAPGERRFRLRLVSLDRRGEEVRLSAAAGEAPRRTATALNRGFEVPRLPDFGPELALVAVDIGRPGCFRLQGARGASGGPGRALREVRGAVAAFGSTLWLSASTGTRIQGERHLLDPDGETLHLWLAAGERALCDVRSGIGPWLGRASSVGGQPGLLATGSGAAETSLDKGYAVAPGRALGVAPKGAETVAVWASGSVHGTQVEVTLALESLRTAAPGELLWGASEGEQEAGTVRLLRLPAGRKRMRLALLPGETEAGLAALWQKDGEGAGLSWAASGPYQESFETVAGGVWMLSPPGNRSSRFRAEILPADDHRWPELVAGRAFEARPSVSGWLRLPVAEPQIAEPHTLHVRGAEEVVFLGADGSVARGTDLPLPKVGGTSFEGGFPKVGGTLLVRHSGGGLLAWVDRPSMADLGPWSEIGEAEKKLPRVVAPPLRLPLSGRQLELEMHAPGPRLLTVRGSSGGMSRLDVPGRAPRVEVHHRALWVAAYVPAGPLRLTLRAGAERALSGAAEIFLEEIPEIAEGLGPEVVLPAGGARAFFFRVERAGQVGLGASSGSGVVETVLLAVEGEILGRGAVQMRELSPGGYVLMLRAPVGGEPLRARPAVSGLEPPDTGPPDEVIRRYLGLAGASLDSPESPPELSPSSMPSRGGR